LCPLGLRLPPSSSPADTDPSIPFAVWLKDFLLEFEDVVNPSMTLPPLQSSDVFHLIKTTGPPIASRFRRLDGETCGGEEGI
jgi:hypothetical protein